jgi:phosphoenolpyruvate synthase/pyruvate phosphate dikinase
MKYTSPFSKLTKKDADKAGGKGASLGEMTQAGIPVPEGFVILSTTFDYFLHETDLTQEIDAILKTVDHKAIHTVEGASEKIRGLIEKQKIPVDVCNEIKKEFKSLETELVAVRSSATAEDGTEHAWAGQLESFLNTTKNNLLENVKKCWSSLFTPRAIFYRFEKELHETEISVAVVIQKMIQSEFSGIAFSVHPVTEDKNQLIIEAGFGLGEAIVSGSITPDSYVVEKEPRKIIDTTINTQKRGLFRKTDGGNEWKEIYEPQASSRVLKESQILELADLIVKIENHYGFPCDIEWAYESGKFYIVQSRPITTLSTTKIFEPRNEYELTFSRECTVPTLQTWYLSENDKFSNYIDYHFPKNGWMFFEYIGGLARNYIDMSIIKNAYDFALNRTLRDKNYFESIEKSFWHYLDLIKSYLTGEKDIETKEELKDFFDKVTEVWGAETICYAFTFFENPEMPKDVFQRSDKIRLAIETIIDDCNKVFVRGLQNIFGKKYVDDYQYLTIEEIISKKIPEKNILKQRGRYIIYFKGIRYDNSLDNFLVKENKFLEKIEYNEKGELKGQIAYKGCARGVAKICLTSKEMSKVQKGDVFVCAMTTPNLLPAVKLASAIVTDEGGVLCHAAIISRELQKPCIIGTKVATQVLKDGDLVEVDANVGVVKILKRS